MSEAKARFDAANGADIGFAERLVWFWSNHFCVFADKDVAMVGAYEREAIRPHVLGRLRRSFAGGGKPITRLDLSWHYGAPGEIKCKIEPANRYPRNHSAKVAAKTYDDHKDVASAEVRHGMFALNTSFAQPLIPILSESREILKQSQRQMFLNLPGASSV